MRIIKKSYQQYKGKVNDLSVENSHTYNVEGLGVHNSVGGSLVAYLLGITKIDPIQYNLLFSRFLNSGRFSEGNVSLPDIDMDVPTFCRDNIIEYIRDKYGHDKVSQIITLGRFKGRSALSEIASKYADIPFAEAKEMTECLPDEARVADELEEMDVKSVIMWTLENHPKRLNKWCKLVDGQIVGEMAELFQLAIRLEGTFKSQGTHPAGVIISNEPISDNAPMVMNKDGKLMAGFEMTKLEKGGLVKFDVLGVNAIDKLMLMTQGE